MAKIEVSLAEFKQIKTWLIKEVGIEVDDSKRYLISGRLGKTLEESNCRSYTELMNQVCLAQNRELKQKVINAITTNETYWFRDERPFKMFKEVLLKDLLPKLESEEIPKLRIWSAACSSGQEPYSLAILVHKLLLHKQNLLSKVEILATDIDTDKIKEAQLGIYNSFSMSRGMALDLKGRYFKKDGVNWVISDEIKKMVKFKSTNLSKSIA